MVVENFRSSVKYQLGVDYDTLKAINLLVTEHTPASVKTDLIASGLVLIKSCRG